MLLLVAVVAGKARRRKAKNEKQTRPWIQPQVPLLKVSGVDGLWSKAVRLRRANSRQLRLEPGPILCLRADVQVEDPGKRIEPMIWKLMGKPREQVNMPFDICEVAGSEDVGQHPGRSGCVCMM